MKPLLLLFLAAAAANAAVVDGDQFELIADNSYMRHALVAKPGSDVKYGNNNVRYFGRAAIIVRPKGDKQEIGFWAVWKIVEHGGDKTALKRIYYQPLLGNIPDSVAITADMFTGAPGAGREKLWGEHNEVVGYGAMYDSDHQGNRTSHVLYPHRLVKRWWFDGTPPGQGENPPPPKESEFNKTRSTSTVFDDLPPYGQILFNRLSVKFPMTLTGVELTKIDAQDAHFHPIDYNIRTAKDVPEISREGFERVLDEDDYIETRERRPAPGWINNLQLEPTPEVIRGIPRTVSGYDVELIDIL